MWPMSPHGASPQVFFDREAHPYKRLEARRRDLPHDEDGPVVVEAQWRAHDTYGSAKGSVRGAFDVGLQAFAAVDLQFLVKGFLRECRPNPRCGLRAP